ncbi:hypothetical protein IFM89_000313 [Coptis chinensis]|uniref:Pentatricopeptide repeat-containing protein n=1 Tax=Coptis chinensis TaxID=261450 RepID=A0A835HAF8_9MAGN|nr:hypothetical protein IFM89_000313 [Coptis chinensis]
MEKNVERIRGLVEEIKRKGLLINVISTNALIKSLGVLGMVEELLLVWRRMKENGIQPSLFMYNFLMDGFVNSMFVESAEKVFEAMESGKVLPDVSCYLEENLDSCLRLFNEMEEKELEILSHAYSLVISGLCKAGKSVEGFSVFEGMVRKGVKPNVAIYTALMDSYANNGNGDEAMKLFQRMKDEGFKPDEVTYGVIVNSLCKTGKLDNAWSISISVKRAVCQLMPCFILV